MDFCSIDVSNILVTRIGGYTFNKPRPISVSLIKKSDVQIVLKNKSRKSRLVFQQGTKYHIQREIRGKVSKVKSQYSSSSTDIKNKISDEHNSGASGSKEN